MQPCRRVGLDVTWKCNWNCLHCFYRHGDQLHTNYDVPVADLLAKVDIAKAGGLDHVVLVGWGEPSLYREIDALADSILDRGMSWSMITNGATGLRRFIHYYLDLGIDHLHISSHGNLNVVSERANAADAQRVLKLWLADANKPFRTNITMQKETYRQMIATVNLDIAYGSRHCVLLGFLPHYDWAGRAQEVAVHPAELRPYIEAAAAMVLDAGRLLTIRYHPLCHLDPMFWPYVVNARYVGMDNTEWNYVLQANDCDAAWASSVQLGESVACHDPCDSCIAYRHCGGWNRHNVAAFNGAGLVPITVAPEQYTDVWDIDGGLFDLNPAARLPSDFGRQERACLRS